MKFPLNPTLVPILILRGAGNLKNTSKNTNTITKRKDTKRNECIYREYDRLNGCAKSSAA